MCPLSYAKIGTDAWCNTILKLIVTLSVLTVSHVMNSIWHVYWLLGLVTRMLHK